MGPKMIVLYRAAPMRIDHPLAGFARADAVFPVVLIGKTAARPAQHGNFDLFKRFHNIVADTVRIGNRRILANPDSFINAASQVLGEMSVNVAVDNAFADVRIQYSTLSHKKATSR
ncbi:hypothetical protein D3C73_1324810 [compost metagenome]